MSDSDSGSEVEADETLNVAIDPICIKYISIMKQRLHKAIINGRPIMDPTSQNNKWIIKYRDSLRRIYDLIHVLKQTQQMPLLTEFPPMCIESIETCLAWINNMYRTNTYSATIPYEELFVTHLKTHPSAFIISSNNIE